MTLIEEYNEAVKDISIDGDYKDYAEATYCACLNYADSGKASEAFKKWIADAPDGADCPRAWLGYMLPDKPGGPQPLTGKWNDEYVQELGILEHCDEVLALHRAHAIAKAERRIQDAERIDTKMDDEMVDLYLILDRRYRGAPLVVERAKKFLP